MTLGAAARLRGVRQPDPRTCGPTCVVAARMLADPGYARRVRPRLADEVLALHRTLTGPRDERGRWQAPWPRALGTPPWALARALAARVRRVRWDDVVAAAGSGTPVALYVGTRLLPRHVVLAVDVDHTPAGAVLVVHDPARGGAVEVTADQLRTDTLPFGSFGHGWFALTRR